MNKRNLSALAPVALAALTLASSVRGVPENQVAVPAVQQPAEKDTVVGLVGDIVNKNLSVENPVIQAAIVANAVYESANLSKDLSEEEKAKNQALKDAYMLLYNCGDVEVERYNTGVGKPQAIVNIPEFNGGKCERKPYAANLGDVCDKIEVSDPKITPGEYANLAKVTWTVDGICYGKPFTITAQYDTNGDTVVDEGIRVTLPEGKTH